MAVVCVHWPVLVKLYHLACLARPADEVIVTTEEDLVERVKQITGAG
jgi:hypothetical protein